MKKLFLAFVMLAGAAFAQSPDCFLQFTNQTIAGTTNYQDNRRNACTNWVLTYQVTGFTAVSLQFESATGASSPGSFAAFSGSVVSGVNPSTSVACSTVANCTAVFTGQVGWYRLNLSSVTGSGTVSATLKGYIGFIPLGGNTGQPGGCPTATPCVVVGPTAAGAPPTTAPVLEAGSDGTNVQTVRTDTNGRSQVVGAAATGAAVAGNPVYIAGNGAGSIFAPYIWSPANGGFDAGTANTGEILTAAIGPGVDGASAAANGFLFPVSQGVYDGTNGRVIRSASLANMPTARTLTAVNSIGAPISERGARWVVNSHPAASSQATATIAAEANVRHVADCVTFSAAAGGAVTAATHSVTLRDGAAGAGTILIQWTVATPTAAATGIQEIPATSFCGFNLVGTTNTAMTFEFDAGVTNLIETVSISGYNVN